MSFPTRAGTAIFLVACTIVLSPVRAALSQAVVAQPRGTGYFVGDQVTQRVLLEHAGHAVSPVSLPMPGRVSAWFERRTASIQSDTSSRRWLVVEYQILNAPSKLMTVKLPAWSLPIQESGLPVSTEPRTEGLATDKPASDPGAQAALAIPAASINIAPLSPPGSPTQVGTADLRADRLPPSIALDPLRRSIQASSIGFCLTLIAWLGWVMWRNRRALAMQPFASALREMRALDDTEPRAWQVLHRAFDRTAGRVIQHATLPTLFERAPQFIPVRTQIEQFFAQSSLLFFTSPEPSGRPGAGGVSPRALCAELRQIEKRHER